jgi:hypothetical protein
MPLFRFWHRMAYLIYDYVSADGTNDLLRWARQLQVTERAKLTVKLDMLQMHGPGLRPQVLTGTDLPGIQKLRVHGGVQLRPLLCEGPQNVRLEFTLLAGATEVQGELKPRGVLHAADDRKREVAADSARRRIHERP